MFIVKPPSVDEPLKMKNYLLNYKNYIFSQEIITEKFKYLTFVNSIFPNVRSDVQSVIYDGIFSLARDLSPTIRVRAMTILSETAPIPKEWVFDTLSKGSNELSSIGKSDVISSSTTTNFKPQDQSKQTPVKTTDSKSPMVNRPYIGTIGMCLEDPYPEVRSSAIAALVKSVTKSNDPHATEVMTAITQLTNDVSPLVRTAAIKGLYQTSTIVGHLVQLEDSQLRLILPIIVDKESNQNDRIEVLKFIERLSVTSYDQMEKVSKDLSQAVGKCDWGILLVAAYTFGRHNQAFARIISCNFFFTLWASYFDFPYPARKVLINVLIVLGAYDEEHFPLQKAIQQIGPIFTPLLMQLRKQYEENMMTVKTDEEINSQNDTQKIELENSRVLLNPDVVVNEAVDLEFLKNVIQSSELSLREVLVLNDALKDSCEFLLGKAPKSVFENEKMTIILNNNNGAITSTNIPQSPNSLSSLNFPNSIALKNRLVKYRGQITLPQQNTKFFPIPYPAQENFKFLICGKVSPYPKDAILLLSMSFPMSSSSFFPVEMKPDGSFLFQPSISLPPFSPFCKIELSLLLKYDDNDDPIPIMDKSHELWFKMS